MEWFSIIFYILLLDALVANLLAWSGKQHWWQTHFGAIATHFPLARGWTVYYLVLIMLLGIALYQTNHLVLPL